MIPSHKPTGAHLHTFETIFRHPAAHNLAWRDVHSLLRHLGQVVEEPNGNLRATRNGQTLVLRMPRTKDVAETSELMELRHFILRSETPLAETDAKESHWLLVIDHHQARIFRSEMHGSVPQQILSHEPEKDFRPAHGQEKPNQNSFFEPVARALKDAGEILVFGSGKGTSSEMEQFIAWVKQHHHDLAGRIIGSLVVDEHHLTEAQLLAKAREFYAHSAAPIVAQR